MVFRILLIVVLNLVWVGVMVGTLIMPTMPQFIDNPTLNSLMTSVLCEPNERLQRVQSESAGINSFCVNTTSESKRNVSETWFMSGLIGTIIAFMLGTLAEVLFAASLFRAKSKPKVQPEVEFIQQPKPPLNINITETLRQLEEAQKAGLMTYDEYDQKRQEIFKNL